ADFNTAWGKFLHDGIIAGSRFAALEPELKADAVIRDSAKLSHDTFEVNTVSDSVISDGASANNGWLQELPRPVTRITWGNAVFMSPKTAKGLGIENEMMVELEKDGKKITGPAWIVPGHAAQSFTVNLGYGRTHAGKVSSGVGFDANAIRVSASPDFQTGVNIRKIDGKHKIACVQDHHSMEGRHLVRETDVENFKKHPEFAQHMSHEPAANNTLYNPSEHLKGENQWGMTIDLNTCIGCNACTIACQSENNIPIVGYDQVLNGREMHWIRVDRYFEGDIDDPKAVHQPVPCMHCENAPCEPVCPVGATTHSDTGLNDMVYNRCVGTRYCSNNCTYKVRRFNFYQYSDLKTPSKKLGTNPDVTVRTRGVMEKCTFCVQRINAAHIEARKEDRKIKDGEIVTACQQTCPTQAIQFGDIKDKTSKVAIDKADGLNYGILTELGTRPRTSYLAKLRNPNPILEKVAAVSGHAAGGHH
ncbi:MAG: 4Fe-4S dicluster domain-containing protein, partial [Candidatus Omnitrophica bacterium]|nr:4Fe-4S dicluster domain-containing protein [Candidatus Omnitrophota bacterium]